MKAIVSNAGSMLVGSDGLMLKARNGYQIKFIERVMATWDSVKHSHPTIRFLEQITSAFINQNDTSFMGIV